MTSLALQRDRRQPAPDDFPSQLRELLGLLENDLPASHPFARLAAHLPGLPEAPVPWLLGSSEQSAIWAGQLGLPYAFADFINPRGAEIAAVYREHFTPSTRLEMPQLAVATWAICADTDEEAERLSASGSMAMSLLRRGRLIAVPPVAKALRYLAQEGAGAGAGSGRRRILGAPAKVRAELERLADAYGADEVIVVSITYDHDARRRSYELIADAFALKPVQLA